MVPDRLYDTIQLYRLKHKETGLYHTGERRYVATGWSSLSKNGKMYQRTPTRASKRMFWHKGREYTPTDDTWEIESWTGTWECAWNVKLGK